jgi:hypothetical protein
MGEGFEYEGAISATKFFLSRARIAKTPPGIKGPEAWLDVTPFNSLNLAVRSNRVKANGFLSGEVGRFSVGKKPDHFANAHRTSVTAITLNAFRFCESRKYMAGIYRTSKTLDCT